MSYDKSKYAGALPLLHSDPMTETDVLDAAKTALRRLHRAMENGTGFRCSADEVQALSLTSLGEPHGFDEDPE